MKYQYKFGTKHHHLFTGIGFIGMMHPSLTRAHNLSSLQKWPSEPSEWKRRNKSQSLLPTATPTVDTPDRQRYKSIGVTATMLQRRFYYCCCQPRTIDVMGGDGFVDILLVEAPALKRGGCGACGKGKGRNGGKWGETVFWGDTKPVVVVCGASGWLAKESGLN
eukprot:scaffold28463_cov64-Attheya_sp.AAC.1